MGFLFHKKLCLFLLAISACYVFFGAAIANPNQFSILQLNTAEVDWLANHSVIKVAVSQDYAPISFVNEDGQHVGISADYLKNIEKQLKVFNPQFQFQTVVPSPAQQAANNPLNKNVDLVVDFVDTPRRQKYWKFTNPYLTLPLHLVVQQDSKIKINLNQYENIKVAVVAYYAANELIATDYPNTDLILVSNNQEGLKKVAFGDVEAFVTDLPVASFWANEAGLMQLKDAGALPYEYKISFASNRQLPFLNAILDKSLANISIREREKINDRWMIGSFINKPLLSNFEEWLVLTSAVLLAFAAAWLIKRTVMQNKRQAKQQQTLNLLAHNQLKNSQDADAIYCEIAQLAADTLQVERASIWMFDDAKKQLECICLYLKSSHTFTSVKPLLASDLPVYFNALASNRVIAITDAMRDPVTAEFKPAYLPANNIGAMLDGTIRQNGETIGVVCLEHTSGTRKWTLDEQSFAGSVADLCRINLETCTRRNAELAMIKLNENLEQEVVTRASLLLETEKRYNYVLQHAPIPILILKKNGEIVEVNPEAEAAFGAPRKAMIGKNFVKTVVADESRKTTVLMAARTLRGEAFRNVELVLQNANGDKLEHICSIGMVTDLDDGK